MIPGITAGSSASAGPPPGGGLLDDYTTAIWSAISLRRLLSSYSGPCLKVQRSSDNTQLDIGFDGADVDVAAMLAFVGAGNGFIRTLYDQSDAGNHFVQATSANQPRIVSAGVYDGVVRFDGTSDILVSANPSGTPGAMTFHLHTLVRALPDTFNVFLELGTGNGGESGFSWFAFANSPPEIRMVMGPTDSRAAPSYYQSGSGVVPNGGVQSVRGDRSQVNPADALRLYIDGSFYPRDFNNDGVTPPTANLFFQALTWNLGARTGASLPTQLSMTDLVIYETAQSDADIAAIAGILM